MSFVEAIARKRRGEALLRDDVRGFVRGATAGDLPVEQLAAMLMAICCRGMTTTETGWLTRDMLRSGETWELGSTRPDVIDKHSTGGVGDTVSLVLAPLLASVGTPVAMMAGRGLGHSQGTLDKLGMEADFVHVGRYKSAPESLTRETMSPEFRKQFETVIDDFYRQMVETIAADRGLAADQVEKLIDQMQQADINLTSADDKVSNDDKKKLLAHLRTAHGKSESDATAPRKVTLKRKSVSELRVTGSGPRGATRTVNVEVRKKRTYVKRADLLAEEQERLEQEAAEKALVEAEEQARMEAARQAKEAARQEEERKRAEEEARHKAEEEARKKAAEEARQQSLAEAEARRKAEEARGKKPAEGERKGRRGEDKATRYGRRELHVASDKRGQRKGRKAARTAAADVVVEDRRVFPGASTGAMPQQGGDLSALSESGALRRQYRRCCRRRAVLFRQTAARFVDRRNRAPDDDSQESQCQPAGPWGEPRGRASPGG